MLIYGDRAVLLGESTIIHSNKNYAKACPMEQFELNAVEEGAKLFDALIESDFTEAAMNANIITEAVGGVLLEEQKENIFQRFWNWLHSIWEKFCNAVKGLWEKIKNFFTKKKVKSGEYSADEVIKAFKEGDLNNIHFNNFIEWNVEAFDSVSADKFKGSLNDLADNISSKFDNFIKGDKKIASTKEYYFNKLPLTEGKNASASELTNVMEGVLIKNKGKKEGLTDQEKTNLLNFYGNSNKYQEEFRKLEKHFSSAYNGLKRKLDEFIQNKQSTPDGIGGKIKKAASGVTDKLYSHKINFASKMVSTYQSAISQWLNTYSGFLTRAQTSITTTIEAGGRAALKRRDGAGTDDKSKKDKKKDKAQNESFIFDGETMGFEEAVDYLSEAEEEYETLMAEFDMAG